VNSKPMMGCHLYFLGRKFIGFLVTDGIVVIKLSDKDQDALKNKFGGKPFEMTGQTSRLWVTPLKAQKDLKQVLSYVKKRYEEIASTKPKLSDCFEFRPFLVPRWVSGPASVLLAWE